MAVKYPKSTGFFTKMASDEVGSLNFGLLVSSLVPLVLLFMGYASQIIGVFLVVIFFYNTYALARKKGSMEEISDEAEKSKVGKYVAKSVLGFIGVVACVLMLL
jgi:uncharacterized protein YacL